uniref:Uncharacterized protein n=1 Tax=Oryza punctata TaxID=4537 RepID=A0A0E0JL01_ORYPU
MQNNWEVDRMLDIYIYDYFVKRNLQAAAKAFQSEGNVSTDPVVFWDIFIAQTDEEHSDVATSYIETQKAKAEHQKHHQQQPKQEQQQQQQIQMQRMLLQRAAQQQQQQLRRDGSHLLNGITSGLSGKDLLMRHNPATANAMAVKMYEERLKLPFQRYSLDEASMKNLQLQQRYGENYGQVLDPNQASLLKAATCGQSSGPILHGGIGGLSNTLRKVQARSLQLSIPEQFLTPQHQQQLLLQTQQNMASPTANDVETRRLRILHNNKIMAIQRDGQINSSGHTVPNIGSPDQSGGSRNKIDMIITKIAHLQPLQQQGHSQQQQLQQSTISHQQALSTKEEKKNVSSFERANRSGTSNIVRSSPSYTPSTPSTHTPGDESPRHN